MSEIRGLELKDSGRRPQREPCSSGTGWPRLLGVPATEVITVTVGPSLGQSVQSVLGSRLALSMHRRFCVGPRAGYVWPRGQSNCRKSGEDHTFRALHARGCVILQDTSLCISRALRVLAQVTSRACHACGCVPGCPATIRESPRQR